MEGRTSLVIAHRLATVIDADTILVLSGGRLAEHGATTELLGRPAGAFAAIVDALRSNCPVVVAKKECCCPLEPSRNVRSNVRAAPFKKFRPRGKLEQRLARA